MKIVYYTDKEGKIVGCNEVKNMTDEKICEAVRIYNRKPDCKNTACVVEIEDDSLTAYLFREKDKRKQWDEQIVDDAISSLENALDFVRSLK